MAAFRRTAAALAAALASLALAAPGAPAAAELSAPPPVPPPAGTEGSPPAASSPAPTEQPGSARFPYFVGGRLGAFVPSGESMFGPELESGLDWEIAAGMTLSRLFAAELSVGHYVATESYADTFFSTFRYEYDLGVTAVNASVRLSLATTQRFDLYALGGAGLYSATLTAKQVRGETVTRETSTTERPLGLHVGAGAALAIASRVRVGAQLKYAAVNGKYSAPGDLVRFEVGGFRGAVVLELRL